MPGLVPRAFFCNCWQNIYDFIKFDAVITKPIIMKRLFFIAAFGMLLMHAGITDLYGQGRLLRKIQEEAEKKAIEEIFGKEKEGEGVPAETPGEASRSGRNTRGGGLSQTVPDVKLHISEAQSSFASNNYSSAKASLRQALWGVELEMGQQVLKSLPESVAGLDYIAENDRVSSSGAGFVGLVIERAYSGKDDMELSLSVGNDAGLFGIAHMAVAGGMYVNTSDQPGQKQIRFQDHSGYIQFDESDGYTMSIPFGQSSLFLLQGINFNDEASFMAAANQFSIQTIKQKLGEQ